MDRATPVAAAPIDPSPAAIQLSVSELISLFGLLLTGITLIVSYVAWRWTVNNTEQAKRDAKKALETQRRAVLGIEPDANGVAITLATTGNPPGFMSFSSRVRNTGQFRAINIEPEVLYDGKPVRVQQFPQALQPDGVGVRFHFDLPLTGEQLPSAPIRLRATFEDGNETSVPMDECFFIDHVAYSEEAGGQPYTSRPCSAPS